MKKGYRSIVLWLSFLLVISLGRMVSVAQGNEADISSLFQSFRADHYQEKVYVQTDRDLYLTGETMWFKVYCFEGSSHKISDLSKVVYVELVRDSLSDVARAVILLEDGRSGGSLYLPTTLSSGNYTLRAYTKWMNNFDEAYFFHRTITIINPFKRLGLEAGSTAPSINLQLFPEGGYLVKGQQSNIGFIGTDQRGRGIDFHGWITDEIGQKVMEFMPLHAGIGSFTFTPEAQKSYTAHVIGPDSVQYDYPFPEVLNEGMTLQVENHENSIKINVSATGGGMPGAKLFVHTRNIIQAFARLDLAGGHASYIIDKSKLPAGISHITLFDTDDRPACERLVYVRPEKLLKIEIDPESENYAARDRIMVDIAATLAGKTSAAGLSVSVFRYDKNSPRNNGDIVSYLLLTSDLKGRIEDPGYYFTDHPGVDEALDNLMLTHGWRRFEWQAILNPVEEDEMEIPEFRNMILSGTLKDKSMKNPVSDTLVYLSSPGKYLQTYVSQSDKNGRIHFELKNFYGNRQIILQTQHKPQDGYDLRLDPVFSVRSVAVPASPLSIGRDMESYLKELSFNMQISNAYKESLPAQNAMRTDTSLFYGDPDERYYLDDYTRFPVMEEVMREYVRGVLVRKRKGRFHFKVIDPTNESVFKQEPLILLDGVPVFDTDRIMDYDPRKVERLDVMTRKYFLGRKVCHGIVNYTTYEGNLEDFDISDADLVMFIDGLQAGRKFYSPEYKDEKAMHDRIPDYRNLLYWDPEIIVDDSGKSTVEFYSSDATGIYRIVVEGITEDGVPGRGEAYIEVKKRK